MSLSHVLVVVVDGLRASALGAYGNTNYLTPALDDFAAASVLFDQCYAPAGDLAAIYQAMLWSRHPLRPAPAGNAVWSLPREFDLAGYTTTFFTDDASLAVMAATSGFQTAITEADVLPNPGDSLPALARSVAAAASMLNRAGEDKTPQLVWLHLRGLYGPWDAPIELQHALLDEGDGAPLALVEPLKTASVTKADPDAVFRYQCAYSAQVMLLDDCWSELLKVVDGSTRGENWLVALLGARGLPLGEHGRLVGIDERLYAEQVHVPWLVRFPDGRHRLSRCGALVSHLDLMPTLHAWLVEQVRTQPEHANPPAGAKAECFDGVDVMRLVGGSRAGSRGLLSTGRSARTLRTPEWSLRLPEVVNGEAPATSAELYVRPDDRWEANDVAARCPDVAAELSAIVTATSVQIEQGQSMPAVLSIDSQPNARNR